MTGWNARTGTPLVLSGLATVASWICYFRVLNVGSAHSRSRLLSILLGNIAQR